MKTLPIFLSSKLTFMSWLQVSLGRHHPTTRLKRTLLSFGGSVRRSCQDVFRYNDARICPKKSFSWFRMFKHNFSLCFYIASLHLHAEWLPMAIYLWWKYQNRSKLFLMVYLLELLIMFSNSWLVLTSACLNLVDVC
jgi:hypothetical protein